MGLNRFCAKCGKPLKKAEVFDGFLCEACYGQDIPDLVLPPKFMIRQCVMCGAYSLRFDDKETEWRFKADTEENIDFLTKMLYEEYFYHIENKEHIQIEFYFPSNFAIIQENDAKIVMSINFNDENKSNLEKPLIVKFRTIHCVHCAKKLGGRFDSVLQVRIQHERDDPKLDEIYEECQIIESHLRFNSPKQFISKKEDCPHGFDLKLSTNSMLKLLSNRLRARYNFLMKLTKKLIGVNPENGGELYRHYALLKLVPVEKNDLVEIDGQKYWVKKVAKNKIGLQEFGNTKNHQVNFSIFEKKKWQLLDQTEIDEQ